MLLEDGVWEISIENTEEGEEVKLFADNWEDYKILKLSFATLTIETHQLPLSSNAMKENT